MMAITLAAFCGGAFAQSATQPDVHVGDRWAWQHTNKLANEMDSTDIEDIIEITDKEIRTRLRVKGRNGSAIMTFDRDWNRIDAANARYAPSLKEFDFPLAAGKTWTADADKMLFSNGKHGKFLLKGTVGSMEKITVPAGTFEAYKISLVIDATGSDEDANVGHTVETLWYAPAVKRYVKLDVTFSRDGRVRSEDGYELLDFSLR